MLTRRNSLTLLGLCGLLLAGPVSAQTTTTPFSGSGPGALASLDVNSDGMISATEAAVVPGLTQEFVALDGDRNGLLSSAEFGRYRASASIGDAAPGSTGGTLPSTGTTPPPPPGSPSASLPAPASPDAFAGLATVDRNADGMISPAEATVSADLIQQFATLDTDRDGQLNSVEFARFEATGSVGSGAPGFPPGRSRTVTSPPASPNPGTGPGTDPPQPQGQTDATSPPVSPPPSRSD